MIKLPKLSSISKREKMMAIVGASILFLVLGDRLVWAPWNDYYQNIRNEIEELEHSVVQQQQLLARKDRVLREANQLEKYFHYGVQPEEDMAIFLQEVEKYAKQSNVVLKELRPLVTTDSDIYRAYGLEVIYECPLSQCVKFIYLLESSGELFTIEKATLTYNEEDGESLKGFKRLRRIVMKDLADSAQDGF